MLQGGGGAVVRRLLGGKEDRPLLRAGGTSGISFKEFEGSTRDAWDPGPDELMEIVKDRLSTKSSMKSSRSTYKENIDDNRKQPARRTSEAAQQTHSKNMNKAVKIESHRRSQSAIDIATLNKLSEELVKKNHSQDSDNRFAFVDDGSSFVFPSMPPSRERDQLYNRLSKFNR